MYTRRCTVSVSRSEGGTFYSLSGLIITSVLIIWKGLICITGSESPAVVVLSESMEPGFKRVSP